MPARKDFLNRIWDNINTCSHTKPCENCCWEWQGCLTSKSYGSITIRLKTRRWTAQVHRIVWELSNHCEISNGLFCCHTCNNKKCCNPSHLYTATHQENIIHAARDGLLARSYEYRKAVGDRSRGSLSPSAKLTEETAALVRIRYSNGETMTNIAKSFNLGISTIRACLVGRSWKHISQPCPKIRWPLTGENSPNSKLKTLEINAIRDWYSNGLSRALLAKMFRLSWTHVDRITSNK